MTIVEFALLRGGFSPGELRLPASVLKGPGAKPLVGICIVVREKPYRSRWDEQAYQNNLARAHVKSYATAAARGRMHP